MGTNIKGICQRKNDQGIYDEVDSGDFFEFYGYSIYAWLADVRNYSEIEPLCEARGLPEDYVAYCMKKVENETGSWWSTVCWDDHLWETHSHSWLMVDEILDADFDKIVEDRRIWGDARACPKGEGIFQPLREYVGEHFIESVRKLKERGVERIIFWFD